MFKRPVTKSDCSWPVTSDSFFLKIAPHFLSSSFVPGSISLYLILSLVHTWTTRAAFLLHNDRILTIDSGACTCGANLRSVEACAGLAGIVWIGPGLTALVGITFFICGGAVFYVFCKIRGMDKCIPNEINLSLAFELKNYNFCFKNTFSKP